MYIVWSNDDLVNATKNNTFNTSKSMVTTSRLIPGFVETKDIMN